MFEHILQSVSGADWAIVTATLLGPILAVQAQKAVERGRDRATRKNYVFQSLMATRRARLSPDHVRALNMIDVTFYGRKILWLVPWRTKYEAQVLQSWNEYIAHLSQDTSQPSFELWASTSDELLTNLLSAMALDLGFKFDRLSLKRSAYSPQAHGEIEQDQKSLRKLAIQFLAGQSTVRTTVTGPPGALSSQGGQGRVISSLDGTWSVSFEANTKAYGFGIAVIHEGKIRGGDAQYFYVGDYCFIDDRIVISIAVTLYAAEPNSVFGPLKHFSLNISGRPANDDLTLHGFMVENADYTITLKLKRLA